MGFCPDQPSPPDPIETARAQTGTNVSTAIANTQLGNVNRISPTGSLTYNQIGNYTFTDPTTGAEYDIPQFEAIEALNPQQQFTFDQGEAAKGRLAYGANERAEMLNRHFRNRPDIAANAPGWATTPGSVDLGRMGDEDYMAGVQRVEDALMARMEPYQERDREALRTRLANQGVTPGSEAWMREMDDQNRAVSDARLGAILASGQEQNRLQNLEAQRLGFNNAAEMQAFNAEMARGGFQNQKRGQYMNEKFALRNQPLNETTALLSGSQVNMPNFAVNQPSMLPTTDIAGLINANYNQRAANAAQESAFGQSLMGGLFGLGGSGIRAGWFG